MHLNSRVMSPDFDPWNEHVEADVEFEVDLRAVTIPGDLVDDLRQLGRVSRGADHRHRNSGEYRGAGHSGQA